jgi:hypothetical protein
LRGYACVCTGNLARTPGRRKRGLALLVHRERGRNRLPRGAVVLRPEAVFLFVCEGGDLARRRFGDLGVAKFSRRSRPAVRAPTCPTSPRERTLLRGAGWLMQALVRRQCGGWHSGFKNTGTTNPDNNKNAARTHLKSGVEKMPSVLPSVAAKSIVPFMANACRRARQRLGFRFFRSPEPFFRPKKAQSPYLFFLPTKNPKQRNLFFYGRTSNSPPPLSPDLIPVSLSSIHPWLSRT